MCDGVHWHSGRIHEDPTPATAGRLVALGEACLGSCAEVAWAAKEAACLGGLPHLAEFRGLLFREHGVG